MSTVVKNPFVKTRSGEVRGRIADGVVDAFEMKARVNEILNRWPAQCCGISVLKPTLGRIPHAKPVRVALVVDPAGHDTANQVQEGVRLFIL